MSQKALTFLLCNMELFHCVCVCVCARAQVYLADATDIPGFEGQTTEVAAKQLRCE